MSDDIEVCVYASAGMVRGLLDEVKEWNVGIGSAWIAVGDEEWRVLQLDAGDASDESRMSFPSIYCLRRISGSSVRARFEYSSRHGQSRGCRNPVQVPVVVLYGFHPRTFCCCILT